MYNVCMEGSTAKKHGSLLRPVARRKKYYAADGYRAQRIKYPLRARPIRLSVALCALLLPLLIMIELRTDAEIAEWWTTHIQAAYVRVASALTSWLPVSIFEFGVVVLIGMCVFLYARAIVNLGRARFDKILIGVLSVALAAICVLDLYMASMGFAYYRAEMPLPQSQKTYDADAADAVVKYFYDDYIKLASSVERDENGCAVCPYGFTELAERIGREYDKLDDPYFQSYSPRAKKVVNSWALSSMLITGITFLPTGEANVNVAAPPTTRTVTTAHEMAHAKGVLREGDANLLAWYVLVSSDDDYLRYCGYYAVFDDLLVALLLTGASEQYRQYDAAVYDLIGKERAYARKYWDSQPDIIGQIAEFFNDLYLQLNGADNGTGSYGDGTQSGVIIPINPDTGEPDRDPDTGEVIKEIHFSQVQKMFFAIFEDATGSEA